MAKRASMSQIRVGNRRNYRFLASPAKKAAALDVAAIRLPWQAAPALLRLSDLAPKAGP